MRKGPKTVLLGCGAREAAMAEALFLSNARIFSIGNRINPQIERMSAWNSAVIDPGQIMQLIKMYNPRYAVVGPESYLSAVSRNDSIVDLLRKIGIKAAAPGYIPALIELDKSFMVNLLIKYGMGKYIPESKVFKGVAATGAALKTIDDWKDVAIKPAGLTGGKGVKVTGVQLKDKEEAKLYARELLFNGQKIVIQRKETGKGFTLQCFVDKYGFIIFAPLVLDFKLLFDGDVSPNPNTGSMGSINCKDGLLPFVDKTILRQAQDLMRKIVAAIEEETGGECYKGPMYGQFMLTDDGRLVLIEINARSGDPEAINILPLLSPETKFANICRGIVEGTLSELNVKFNNIDSVVKYVVPVGYPGKADAVFIDLDQIRCASCPVDLYYGDIVSDENGNLIAGGSRAIAIRATGASVQEAALKVNNAIPKIFVNCKHLLHWRPCIGLEN